MASALYSTWDRAGRPLTPAQPVRDVVDRMKAAFPRAAGTFGWYADEAHYQASPPQDHTPYSADGWPLPDPHWVVFATDIMHRPDLGVDCNVFFPYWLAEARAGRFPGLKYLIWQAHIYDVRHSWQQQGSAGHFDHIHLSFRTDWQTKGLGSWSLVPGTQEEDDMELGQEWDGSFLIKRVESLVRMNPTYTVTLPDKSTRTETNALVQAVLALETKVSTPAPVEVDAVTLAAAFKLALQDPATLTALAKAVNDDLHARTEK